MSPLRPVSHSTAVRRASVAAVGSLLLLASACGSTEASSPATEGHRVVIRDQAGLAACAASADSVERWSSRGAVPACVLRQQRAAQIRRTATCPTSADAAERRGPQTCG